MANMRLKKSYEPPGDEPTITVTVFQRKYLARSLFGSAAEVSCGISNPTVAIDINSVRTNKFTEYMIYSFRW